MSEIRPWFAAGLACLLSASTYNSPGQASGAAGRSGPAAAREQMKAMKVADGLEVALFASEPMVRNPAAMDVDHRGRVWITEGANYRLWQKWGKLRPEGDRILILEDTTGDGMADKQTVFYQGNEINTALGICVLGEKVIVSCSPHVFIFTDSDGDGTADRKEVLFSGIGGVDHDHGVHSVVFGPDGKLYFNVGDAGREVLRPDGSPVIDQAGRPAAAHGKPYRKGMVFRCNPDGSEFEVLGHNFRNPYEVAVDSFGTIWQSDNDDDGNQSVRINYVMEYGNFGYTEELTGAGWGQAWKQAREREALPDSEKPRFHWHQDDPGVIPNLLVTGAGSPTGLVVYEGKLLPRIFQGQMIHCDAGPRVVRAYPVEEQGAGYRASTVNILTSDDTWFRPSDVCVGPDGALYVADWNDAGVGGHHMADQVLETMTGRVYRIAPPGHRPSPPRLELESASGGVAALQSPNHETRYLAWRRLHAMQEQAEAELLKLWNGNEPRLRARALQLLARIQGKETHYIQLAIEDRESDIRIAGLRIARALKQNPIPHLQRLVEDPSPQVRRECAIALRHNRSPEAAVLWARLARQHDGQDRWYLEALGLGADGQEDRFFQSWLELVGPDWNTPAGRDLVWRSRSSKALPMLVALIKDPATAREDRSRYFRSLDFIEGPEKEEALLDLLALD